MCEVTPRDKIFKIEPFNARQQACATPPSVQQPSRGTIASAQQPSCGVVPLSPTASSKHLAQCVVLDIVHVAEEGIDPVGKILYGQLITDSFDKIVVPPCPSPDVPWSTVQSSTKPDPAIIERLIHCCSELSEPVIRRCVHYSSFNLMLIVVHSMLLSI